MDFDLTTPDNAFEFVLRFTGMTGKEFIKKYIETFDGNFDDFWEEIVESILNYDIQSIRIIAFHVLGSLDDCAEIKRNGIRNLQYMLRENTIMKRMLEEAGISFDIDNRVMFCEGKIFIVDFDYYQHMRFSSPQNEQLESIAHRIYYDFCANGFLVNDNILAYGTDIHKRPEFLHTLCEFSEKGQELDQCWRNNSKSYKITFFAYIDQVHRFNFDLEERTDELTPEETLSIKRWMLSLAIDRSFDRSSEKFLYIKDDEYIPPDQIISYEELME